LDASNKAGGCITSVRRDGYVADGGPQTFSSTPAFAQLAESLNLGDRLLHARAGAGSMFFYSHGKLVPAPASPPRFIASPLLSPIGKQRLQAELFKPPRRSDDDESVADFVARRAGRSAAEALLKPLVRGIYAGDATRLSARSAFPTMVRFEKTYGSVMAGAMRQMRKSARPRRRIPVGVRGGNDGLPNAIAAALSADLKLGRNIVGLVLRGANVELAYDGAQPGGIVARHAVLALPAGVTGPLLTRLEPEAAEALSAVPCAAMSQVALSYPRDAVQHPLNGFGFLAGEHSDLRILGCTWNSSMFEDRCPKDRVLVTAFLGGTSDPDVTRLKDDELVRIAHADLQRAIGITDAVPHVVAGFRWDQAIPQYEIGHAERLATIEAGLSRLPQVSIVGNFIDGPGVADCIAVANAVAARVLGRLRQGQVIADAAPKQ
jgi:oxygen-dependent protoporphyrinogen oxidase